MTRVAQVLILVFCSAQGVFHFRVRLRLSRDWYKRVKKGNGKFLAHDFYNYILLRFTQQISELTRATYVRQSVMCGILYVVSKIKKYHKILCFIS